MWWAIVRELNLDANKIILEQARDILQQAIAIYNHSVHSTTSCIPFELFHKCTDRNFYMPHSSERVSETFFTNKQYTALVEKARNSMAQAAAKSVARYGTLSTQYPIINANSFLLQGLWQK